MARILIIYSSKYGQTKKISEFIGNELRLRANLVDIYDVEKLPDSILTQNYDKFIVGSSVHMSSFSKSIQKWVIKNKFALGLKPSAFFSVCLGVLQKEESVQEAEQKILNDFFKEVSWWPKLYTIFAGALPYSKYNWFLKRIMRAISRRAGAQTDISKDYEYTNWDEVKLFADNFIKNHESSKR